MTGFIIDDLKLPDEKINSSLWRNSNFVTPPASDAGSVVDDISCYHKKLSRSKSEPRGRYNKHNNTIGSASLRYKTELCHPYEENGTCKYGEKCQFAHGHHELRDLARHPKYKTELCRTFHAEGYCPYGARCHFIHEGSKLSLSPNSLSPASSMTAFAYAAAAPIMICSPPPSPTESRLPIFNEISSSAPSLRSFGRQFGGITA